MRIASTLGVLLALLALLAAPAVGHTTLKDPAKIAARLVASPKAGGIVTGDAPVGAVVWLGAGDIELTQPLVLGSGDELVGQGAGITRIVWKGGPGTAAVHLHSYADHGWVHRPALRRLSIVCPNGADAIAQDASVKGSINAELDHVAIVGGRVNLAGEHYHAILANVQLREPRGQAVRLDGQNNVLRDVDLAGGPPAGFVAPEAMVEVRGSVTIEGATALQGAWPCPLLLVRDWYGHSGYAVKSGGWIEPHANGVMVRLVNARYVGDFAWFAAPGHPWELTAGSWIRVAAPFDAGGVRADGTSKAYVGGVLAATEPIKPSD